MTRGNPRSGPDHPIDGQVILLAGAQASVTLDRLSELVRETHAHLEGQRGAYDRRFERLDGIDDTVFYLVDGDHWAGLGRDLGFEDREVDAVRRAHETQFRRTGRRLDRREEFEAALEIRDVVALYPPSPSSGAGSS